MLPKVGIDPEHVRNAAEARRLYLDSLNPAESAADWHFAVREARELVSNALRASRYLSDVASALKASGAHALVFRQMLAPPVSQDQFRLICPKWSKTSENKGSPLNEAISRLAGEAINARLDRGLVRWSVGVGPKSRRDITTLIRVASTLIALQRVSTARRKRISFEQESAVTELLKRNGWIRLPSKLIDTRAAVPPRHFMRKTRFATKSTAPQEVDIACGLNRSYVLAMECKVTNDETNSVKRINDVLKKAAAWKEHWGSFVITAALLQGVIAAKDVQRLSDAGVLIFWSHELNRFEAWLNEQMAP